MATSFPAEYHLVCKQAVGKNGWSTWVQFLEKCPPVVVWHGWTPHWHLWMWYAKANVHRHWRVSREINAHNITQSMQEMAEEEKKRYAIATKSFHQGIPSITMVVDGNWLKRTHKHSYNAKSAVAVIFGSHTRKLLFMWVRNKSCAVCAKALMSHRGHTSSPTAGNVSCWTAAPLSGHQWSLEWHKAPY